MPIILHNDYIEEKTGTGTLELDANGQNYFAEHINGLLDLAQCNNIPSPHLTESSSRDDVKTSSQEIISTILANIIVSSLPSEDNQVTLGKCLTQLKLASKSYADIFTSHLNQQLISILIKDNYPAAQEALCALLKHGEYQIDLQEAVELGKIFISSNSNSVLELLAEKEAITVEVIEHIIKNIKSVKPEHPSYSTYKDQLLIAVNGLSNLNNLDEAISSRILDLFIGCVDKSFVSEMLYLFNSTSFFGHILQEIKDSLFSITKLLNIDQLAQDATRTSQEGIKAKHQLKCLLEQPNTFITDAAAKIISKDFTVTNKTLSKDAFTSEIFKAESLLKKILDNKITMGGELINGYQQYLLAILHSPTLISDKKNYPRLLISNTCFCIAFLHQGNFLSQEVTESLISSLSNNEINLPIHTQNVSLIIFKLALINKVPDSCVNKSISILKKAVNAEHPPTIINIALSFQAFALSNIQDYSFTNTLCSKHLASTFYETKEAILNGLHFIVSHSSKLPEGVIISLAKFIQDKNQEDILRIRAIELLGKVASSIKEQDLSNLSRLLHGERKNSYIELAPDTQIISRGDLITLQNADYFKYQQLERYQLEKYVASNGFTLKNIEGDGNCFFHALADQLSLLVKEISFQEIRNAAINELIDHPSRYREFVEGDMQGLDYDQFIRENILSGVWADDIMIQASANALKININIYRFDKTVTEKEAFSHSLSNINIGYTGDHYLSLIKFNNINIDSSNNNNCPSSVQKIEQIDYKVAINIAQLLLQYAITRGTLPSVTISYLEQGLHSNELAPIVIEVLSIIAEKNPTLLKTDLVDYVKEHDQQIGKQISFTISLQALNKLLTETSNTELLNTKTSNKTEALIKEELGKIILLLNSSHSYKSDTLYEIISKLLNSNPDLFNECLQLVKLANSSQKNIELVNKLLDFEQVTCQDLCWFVNHGYKSPKLYQAIEKYFNDNILALKDNPNSLGGILFSLQLVAYNLKLHDSTINNLISTAKANINQAANIVKILYLSSASLTSNHCVLLEELFAIENLQLRSQLSNLFTKANKLLTTPASIEALFENLGPKTPLNILPTNSLILEAQTLLKLKSQVPSSDKLILLQTLAQESVIKGELQPETIKTLLQLIKDKYLSKAAIKILANLRNKPTLDKETSEIICLLKDELASEYASLKSFLTIDADEFLQNQKPASRLKNILEARFTNLYLTNFAIDKIAENLASIHGSEQFIELIVFDQLLAKASSLEEWSKFLEFIIKNKVAEADISYYLGQPSLTKITDVIESKLLTKSLQSLEESGLTNYIDQISYLCYQLKGFGLSVSALANILLKINAQNAPHFINHLRAIDKYQITEEQRNKKGETLIDVINKYSDQDLESAIYSIASNQFEYKLENKGAELLEKLVEFNPELESRAAEYVNTLEKIHTLYSNQQVGGAISGWSAAQVKDWVVKFKASHVKEASKDVASKDESSKNETATSSSSSVQSWPKDDIAQIITVLQRANNLHTEASGKDGHLLRDTQLLSLLLLLDENLGSSGKLLQISTGEGKSTVSAMLAAILSLHGYKVDLVTSSKVLAATGQSAAQGFFKLLGLTCSLNTEKSPLGSYKACYDCDIVYGDALTFQSDFLSNISHQGPKRGDREFAVTIVDEVDSMLLDGSNHFAKQATPTPLMEYLLPVLVTAWHNFHSSILPLELEKDVALEKTTKMLEDLIGSMPIPKHFVVYAKFQAKNWAASLIGAATQWQVDRDYVINIDSDGKKVINPVDSSTGVTQESMVWQNGLHQFLQIKHDCRVSPETLTSFFITNISYFLKYDKILGMTGTLGSLGSQDFLKTVYGVELTFVPTYKDKQIIELPGRLENTKEQHLEAIVESSYQEAVLHNRAVLIVCKTIKDAEELSTQLKSRCGARAKIINYSRSEERLYNTEIEQTTHSNTIIVATNLAGRGTDIKTSTEVELNGGLHVISTFIAKNARDEAQVKGRTSRQGNCGSYQIIALDRTYYEYESFGRSSEEVISSKRQIRDEQERASITNSIEKSIPSFLGQDELYNKFSKLYLELSNIPGDFKLNNCKIKQLIEDFGLWLKVREHSDNIEDFISNAKAKYHSSKFTNPSYLVTQHYGVNAGNFLINVLSKAIEHDDIYNFAAHYYTAQSWLSFGYEQTEDYKNRAIDSLMETANRVLELLSYLTAMAIAASKSGTTSDNELLKQVTSKVSFFKKFVQNIEAAVQVISQSGEKEVRVKSVKPRKDIAPDLLKADIEEIDFLGIDLIFEVETYNRPKDEDDGIFGCIFVGCCAICQMAVGALITIGSLGSASVLGASIFAEGLMDAYKVVVAASGGKAINLEDYMTSKAISYALIGAQVGFSKMAGANAARKGLEESAKTSIVTTTIRESTEQQIVGMSLSELRKQAITELAYGAGVQLAKTIAVEKIAEWASHEVRDNLLDGLEDKISHSTYNATKLALAKNAILLTSNCNIEREQIVREIQASIARATKTHKSAQIINELSSGVFKAASSSGFGLGSALYAVQKVGSVMDAASKIEPIIDDIKQEIENIIDKAAARATQRLKSASSSLNTQSNTQSDQEAISNSLCSRIGSIVSTSVMNLIQRKITTPIITSGISAVVDSSLEEYQAKQRVVLEVYSKAAINAKNHDRNQNQYQDQDTSHQGKMHQDKMAGEKRPKPGGASNYQSLANLSSEELAILHAMQQKPEAGTSQRQNTDKFISNLPTTLKQPIYIFEDGKLVKVYGKGETGTPISIGFDSKSERYFGLSGKDNSQHSSIYEVIANQTIGHYSTGDLLKMHSESTILAKAVDLNKTKASTNVHTQQEKAINSAAASLTLQSIMQNPKELQSLQKSYTQEQQLIKYQHREIEAVRYLSSVMGVNSHENSTLAINSSSQKIKIYDVNSSVSKNKAPDSSFSISSVIDQALGIHEAQAYGGATIATSQWLLAQNLTLGLGYYGAARGTLALGGTILSTISMPVVISAATTATLVTALHQAAKFESQHPWLSEDFNETLFNPLVSLTTKDVMWQQMRNDPLLVDKQSSRMDIDPNANKVSILSTPIEQPDYRKSILYTPDPREQYYKFLLPGFTTLPDELTGGNIFSTPDHSDWADMMNVLYKKINPDYSKLDKRYLDSDIQYLHDKKYEGANIRDIDPNVRERMAELINSNPSGKIIGIHNTQDHHIIHQATPEALELFKYLELDIHKGENRVTLPSDIEFTSQELTKMTQHVGRHENRALDPITQEVERISTALKDSTMTKEQAKTRLLNFIKEQRQDLETGKTFLNSKGRK